MASFPAIACVLRRGAGRRRCRSFVCGAPDRPGAAPRVSVAARSGHPRIHRRPLRRSRRARRETGCSRSERRRAEGARGDCPRPLRGRRIGAAPRRDACAGQRGRARARLARADARSCRGRHHARAGRGARRPDGAGRWPRAFGTCVARARPVPGGECRVPCRGGRRAAAMPPSTRRGANCSSRNTTSPRRSSRSRPRSSATLDGRRRSSARRARSPTTIRRRRSRLPSGRSRSIRRTSRRRCFSRARRSTPIVATKRVQLLEKALAVNPSSLEAHAWLAALNYVEDKQKEFEAEVAKALAVAPRYGEVYRVAGELAARNYRFDEAVDLARRALALDAEESARARRPRHRTCCARATSPRARTALETSFAHRSLRCRHVQSARADGHARQVRDGPRRRPRLPLQQGRSAGVEGTGGGARPSGADDDGGALRVHAARTDSHRDLPAARRLRGPKRRAAGHDWRARRLLRPRGHDGFAEGAGRRAASSGRRRSGTSWRT